MGNEMYNEALMAGIGIAVVIVWLLVAGLGVATYVMRGIGLYDLGRKRGVRGAWLAWVPGLWIWSVGAVVDYHAAQRGLKRRWRWLLLGAFALIVVGYVLLLVVAVVSMAGAAEATEEMMMAMMGGIFAAYIPMVVGIMAYMPCYYVCIYKVFEETAPEKAVKYLLLSVLVPLAFGICLMNCSRRPVAAVPEVPAIPGDVGDGFTPQDPFADEKREN